MTLDELFGKLRQEGRVGDEPWPAPEESATPWYVRTLLGFCGWLGGVLLVGSFTSAIAMLFDQAITMFCLAGLLCGAAFLAYRAAKNDVVTQFALAVSMTGQVFLAFAIWKVLPGSAATAALVLGAVQCVLVVVMRNPLHRVLSTLFAAAAFAYAFDTWHALGVVGVALALAVAAFAVGDSRWRTSRHAAAIAPVAWGVVIALLAIDVISQARFLLHKDVHQDFSTAWGPAIALVLFAAGAGVRASVGERALAAACAAAFAALAWPAPGVIASALVLLAGFRVASLPQMFLAAAAGLAYLSQYYYFLPVSLLEKSKTLAIVGAALLAASAVLSWVAKRRPHE
jgi:uncharacterized protein DUF4401